MAAGSNGPQRPAHRQWCHRPVLRQLADAGGHVLQRTGIQLPTLDPDHLLSVARRRTGLRDPGKFNFREPLERLARSYEAEAQLTLVGRIATRAHLLQALENLLRMNRDLERYPAISEQPIVRPWFVLGLPRTGSTLLHGLLAQDPENRAPMTWEVMFPSPPPRAESATTDPRIRRCERLLRWFHWMAPGFRRVHPVAAQLPQECIAITANIFTSIEFHTTHYVPGYQRWLDGHDWYPTYLFHKRFLQQLQLGHSRPRWVLKAPAHLVSLQALLDVYPDAAIIQTHRDPLKVVASIASHGAVLRAAFSDALDPERLGAAWADYWAAALYFAIRVRDRNPGVRFIDVHYRDLAAAPLAAVERIYAQLGLQLRATARQRMQQFLSNHPIDAHGRHRYSLADFGLDPEVEADRFARYTQRFSVAAEPG